VIRCLATLIHMCTPVHILLFFCLVLYSMNNCA
jgi:hypothetical protein